MTRARLFVRIMPFWKPCIAVKNVHFSEKHAIQQVVFSLRAAFGIPETLIWVEFEG